MVKPRITYSGYARGAGRHKYVLFIDIYANNLARTAPEGAQGAL